MFILSTLPGTWGIWGEVSGCDCSSEDPRGTRHRICITRGNKPPSAGCMLPNGLQAQEETQRANCTQCRPGKVDFMIHSFRLNLK